MVDLSQKKKEKNYYEKCWEIKCQKMNTEEVDCFLNQQLLYFWSQLELHFVH